MEADLAFRGIDFRDYYRPRGGLSRLTLRRLGVLLRHLPREAHTVQARGGDGFSQLELLVMEAGLAGPVNPRHPWQQAEREKAAARTDHLKGRAAYYAAQRARQAEQAEQAGSAEPAEPATE